MQKADMASSLEEDAKPRYRELEFGVRSVQVKEAEDGTTYIRAEQDLAPYAWRMTDKLVHWAQTTPDHSFMAQRERLADGSTGDWQHISYGQMLKAARSIAQALVDRQLSAERPVLILSENDLDHVTLAMGCLYAGVPYCSVSTPYSLVALGSASSGRSLTTRRGIDGIISRSA